MAPDFKTHLTMCEKCRRYNPERPATMSLLCLEGSILLKAQHSSNGKRHA
jgi:hypothetical protein